MRDASDGLIKDGVLWLYSRARCPNSLPALLSHSLNYRALTKASRSPLDLFPLLGQTTILKEASFVVA